jgi:glycogen(starch) synthase
MRAKQHGVFMVGWEYPPHNSGGLGVACEGLTQALADQQTQIYFTLPYTHPQTVNHMRVIDCHSPTASPKNKFVPPFSAYDSVWEPRVNLNTLEPEELSALPQSEIEKKVSAYADKVFNQSKKLADQYSVIHAHDWMSFPAAMKIQQNLHKPFIAHVHSTEFDRIPSGYGSQYIAHTEYQGLQRATKVIAVSHFTKKMLIEKYLVDPNKIEVVHNGIYPIMLKDHPRFAENRPVVVFMGRLTAQKGAPYFLQLAKSVLREVPEALFVVAGSGDQYHYLLLKNADEQLSASVLFTGFLRDRQREILLNRADVFVMPSVSEPFGLVALEAAQQQTPVIVSKSSGVREILPSAIQVDFWDIHKMTEQIVAIIHHQQYRQSIVEGQNFDLRHATWEKAAQHINQIYHQVSAHV